jgi:hypothetical protein
MSGSEVKARSKDRSVAVEHKSVDAEAGCTVGDPLATRAAGTAVAGEQVGPAQTGIVGFQEIMTAAAGSLATLVVAEDCLTTRNVAVDLVHKIDTEDFLVVQVGMTGIPKQVVLLLVFLEN